MDQIYTPRPHLTAKISQSHQRLIILSAGYGYGKTTLLSQLQTSHDTALIRLSDADPDPISIIRLIASALPTPHTQQHAANVQLPYELGRHNVTANAAALALKHDLRAYTSLTLLIDEAELLTPESRRFLSDNIIQAAPHNVRFVLTMTDPDQFPAQSLRLKLGLLHLTQEDLAFTPAEMADLGLRSDQMDQTKGWPAAAALAALGENPNIVAQELLHVLPENLVATLRRASLLSTWRTDDPANTALQLDDDWLNTARQQGIPMVRLNDTSFVPHPIVQQVLHAQLRARPTEYALAQRALAGSQKARQPLTAVDTYLAAGNHAQARDLLENLIPRMQRAGEIRSALPQLRIFMSQEGLDSPLSLPYARALFDAGEVIEALTLANQVLHHGQSSELAHATLGHFRLRTGNVQEATRHLRAALDLTQRPAERIRLRAHLALALALKAREQGTTTALTTPQHDADQVIAEAAVYAGPFSDIASSVALAHIALLLGLCARGQRYHARTAALKAQEYVQALSPSLDQLLALTILAAYYADEDQPQYAEELYAQAKDYDTEASEPALLLALTRTRLAIRKGLVEQVKTSGRRSWILAKSMNNLTAGKEALIYLLITAALVNTGQAPLHIQEIRTEFGSDAELMKAVKFFDGVFLHRTRITPEIGATYDIPAELRALLLVAAFQVEPRNHLRHGELVDVRNRVGPGVIISYAERLRVTLPPGLGKPIYKLQIQALQPNIVVKAHDLPIRGSANVLFTLLALAWKGQLGLNDQDAAGLGSTVGSRLRMQYHRARTLIDTTTRTSDTLTSIRGTLSLNAYEVHLDIFELDILPVGQLELIYEAPVYGEAPAALVTDPPQLQSEQPARYLLEMRTYARTTVARRISRWAATHPEEAGASWRRLLRVDPELANFLTLPA